MKILLLPLLAIAISGCSTDRAPTYVSDAASDGKLTIVWSVTHSSPSPVHSEDGVDFWAATGGYHYAEKTAAALEPPSNVKIADILNDNGNFLKVSWTPSLSEKDSLVGLYRIFRSRNSTLTEPVPLSHFASIDSLIAAEAKVTVLVDSVAAGKTTYTDFVPLNGAVYYYWLQAVGGQRLSVIGTVRDTDGNTVAGALIQLLDGSGGLVMETSSANDGSFAFYTVPPGTYSLVVKRNGYRIFSATVTVF